MRRIPLRCPLAAAQTFPALLVKTLHTQPFAVSALSIFVCCFPTFSIRASKLLPVWPLSYGVAIRASFRFYSLFFAKIYAAVLLPCPAPIYAKCCILRTFSPPIFPGFNFGRASYRYRCLNTHSLAIASLGLATFISRFYAESAISAC